MLTTLTVEIDQDDAEDRGTAIIDVDATKEVSAGSVIIRLCTILILIQSRWFLWWLLLYWCLTKPSDQNPTRTIIAGAALSIILVGVFLYQLITMARMGFYLGPVIADILQSTDHVRQMMRW